MPGPQRFDQRGIVSNERQGGEQGEPILDASRGPRDSRASQSCTARQCPSPPKMAHGDEGTAARAAGAGGNCGGTCEPFFEVACTARRFVGTVPPTHEVPMHRVRAPGLPLVDACLLTVSWQPCSARARDPIREAAPAVAEPATSAQAGPSAVCGKRLGWPGRARLARRAERRGRPAATAGSGVIITSGGGKGGAGDTGGATAGGGVSGTTGGGATGGRDGRAPEARPRERAAEGARRARPARRVPPVAAARRARPARQVPAGAAARRAPAGNGSGGMPAFQKAAGTIQNTTQPASTTNLQKSQWQQGLISPSLLGGTHLNQPAVFNGYLMMAGNEDFFFYDVSNADRAEAAVQGEHAQPPGRRRGRVRTRSRSRAPATRSTWSRWAAPASTPGTSPA